MRIFLLFVALILASCAPSGPTDAGSTKPPLNPTQACEANGGTYRQVCLMGDWTCVMPYKDAGKRCTDNDQCDGKQCRYLASNPPPQDGTAVGECRRNSDPCGCFTMLVKGIPQGLCVD